MPRRFYFSTNCSRPVVFDNREFKFVPMSILGGRISGVFDTEDETDIAILNRAVAGQMGVTEISEAAAEDIKKKLRSNPRRSANLSRDVLPPRLAKSPVGALMPVVENAGFAASERPPNSAVPAPVSTEITTPTVTSLLRTEKLRPPQPFVDEGKRTKGKKIG